MVERHLDRGERADQHRLVQIAEMADPEDPALQPVEPAAERHVEPVERGLAHRVGVASSGTRTAVIVFDCASFSTE